MHLIKILQYTDFSLSCNKLYMEIIQNQIDLNMMHIILYNHAFILNNNKIHTPKAINQ